MSIFRADQVPDDWSRVRAELERAFSQSREAALAEEHIVYLVHIDDLLGRRGAANAMIAAGLLSAARTAALEGARKGWAANVIAYDDDTDPRLVSDWAERMASNPQGVTGEIIRLGRSHIGKALP